MGYGWTYIGEICRVHLAIPIKVNIIPSVAEEDNEENIVERVEVWARAGPNVRRRRRQWAAQTATVERGGCVTRRIMQGVVFVRHQDRCISGNPVPNVGRAAWDGIEGVEHEGADEGEERDGQKDNVAAWHGWRRRSGSGWGWRCGRISGVVEQVRKGGVDGKGRGDPLDVGEVKRCPEDDVPERTAEGRREQG